MLGKLPVLGVLLIWISVGQGPIALAVGAGGGCLDIFSLIYHFSFLSPSLWETARYRLKYHLKGPLSPNNQPSNPEPALCNASSVNSLAAILSVAAAQVPMHHLNTFKTNKRQLFVQYFGVFWLICYQVDSFSYLPWGLMLGPMSNMFKIKKKKRAWQLFSFLQFFGVFGLRFLLLVVSLVV